MSDEHFMEDENEWPYLVWEKKDNHGQKRNPSPVRRNLNFEDIPFSQFPSFVNHLVPASNHRAKILNSINVRPEGCRFSIRLNDNQINIKLILKNEFLSSSFSGFYDMDNSDLTFYLPFHDHGALESMDWFKGEVRRIRSGTGLGYDGCGGGYDFTWSDGKLTVEDEFESFAYFSDGDPYSDTHSYRVDFKNRKLVKYHVHDWMEMFDPL